MPVNTGPDINTYEIPEVSLSNTFNTWRDVSNISSYKLNKMKIYDGLSTGSVSSSLSSAGVLSSALLPTITTGHTFSEGIRGTQASFHTFNAAGSSLTIGSNATAITMGVVGGTTTILSHVTITGNLAIQGTQTTTNSANFTIADSVISLGQTGSIGVTGAVAFAQDRGVAFFYPDTAASIGASLGFFGAKAGSRNFVYLLNGSTSGINIHSGVTGTFEGHFLGGGATLEKLVVGGTLDVSGIAKFAGGATFSGGVTLEAGATLSIGSGLQLMRGITSIGFAAPTVINNNILWTLPGVTGAAGKVLGVDSTSSSGLSLAWVDGSAVGVAGVTGTDRQVQYNDNGSLNATAGFVFHHTATVVADGGISAGTLGLSGGLWALGNVGIGVTPGAITGQIVVGKSKLQVAGDIRLNGGGFFVNSGMTLAQNCTIVSNDNAIFAGTLNVASGFVLTVENGASLIIL